MNDTNKRDVCAQERCLCKSVKKKKQDIVHAPQITFADLAVTDKGFCKFITKKWSRNRGVVV
jgi:hypothetical protein